MRKTWLIFSQAVTVAVAVLFVVATLKPEWVQRRAGVVAPNIVSLPATQALPVALAGGGAAVSYSAAAKRASPAVVSITASKAPTRNPRSDDPFFQFFFGDRSRQSQQEPQVGLGSGVIVSSEGYLITNNHVIEGADDIEVMLADGRQARAKIVGTDPESDVAVLKIELDRLPAIAFGDVDQLQVGDVVLAIGNPFGFGQTVTSGIVSVPIAITNSSSEASGYLISVQFFDADSTQIGTGFAAVLSVQPGAKARTDGVGTIAQGSTMSRCEIVSVNRTQAG